RRTARGVLVPPISDFTPPVVRNVRHPTDLRRTAAEPTGHTTLALPDVRHGGLDDHLRVVPSRGLDRVDELVDAIEAARGYDPKVIVEAAVPDVRESEGGVPGGLGGGAAEVGGVADVAHDGRGEVGDGRDQDAAGGAA